MKRLKISISQRCDVFTRRSEIRDALDVRLPKLIWELGFFPFPFPSHIEKPYDYIKELAPDGVLLSGGNDIGESLQRDNCETALIEYAKENSLPLLGICRGMQFINHYFGGAMERVDGHVASKHFVDGPIVDGEREVNSFHTYGFRENLLAADLEPLAKSRDGFVEALKHKTLPWVGIMWHPERDDIIAKSDIALIKNLFKEKGL